MHSKLGVYADDLHPLPKVSMELAARLGLPLIQLQAMRGDMKPQDLPQSGRRHVLRFARDRGLSIVALGAELGPSAPGDSRQLDIQVAQICQILELARDLQVPLVTAAVARFENQARSDNLLREALDVIAAQADRVNCPFAVQTTLGNPAMLHQLLQDINCQHLKICYDPGELLIWGQDPLAPIEMLADHIVLSHVRDAVLGSPQRAGHETRLGAGQLDVAAYLQRLAEAGYHGPLLLRRTDAADPVADVAAGKAWIEPLLR